MADLQTRVKALEDQMATVLSELGLDEPDEPEKKKGKKKKGGSKKKASKKKEKKKPKLKEGKGKKKRLSGVARVDFYVCFGRKIFYDYPNQPVDWKEETKDTKCRSALELEWIYGFRGALRDNLFFTPVSRGGEFLYTVAGMAILYNPGEHTQRFFGIDEHTEDVQTCCIHPTLPVAATGQVDPKGKSRPHFCVWNYKTCELLVKREYHDRSVDQLQFSHDGKYLYSIGNDDSHTGTLWECPMDDDESEALEKPKWKKMLKKPICEQMVSKEDVWGCRFAPDLVERDGKKRYEFVTYGIKLFKWHTVADHPSGNGELIIEDEQPSTYSTTKLTQKYYSCAGWIRSENGGVIVGTHTGHVYQFYQNQTLAKFNAVSDKPIGALVGKTDKYYVASNDGQLRVFDWEHTCLETIDLNGAKVTSMHSNETELAMGYRSSEIWYMNLEDKKRELVNDGFNDEVWGLSCHATKPLVCVGAIDTKKKGLLKFYDYTTHRMTFERKLKSGVGGCAFSPDGKFAAFGCKDGTVIVINAEDTEQKEPLYKKKICKEQIDCICFTKNNKYLVFGSWDQTVRVLVTKDWKLKKPMKGHTSSVLRITVSNDSDTVMSNSKDMETLYWSIKTGKRVDSDQIDRNIEWHQWKGLLGWCVQGIFDGKGDFTDVNSVAVSGSDTNADDDGKKLVATGDDLGNVSIFNFPLCKEDDPKSTAYLAHSSHVTDCRFTNDNKMLITAGGGDLAVMQWNVVDAPAEDSD